MKWNGLGAVGAVLWLGTIGAVGQSILDVPQILRVDLDLVLVPVAVTDMLARPVTDLEAENFRVWEDRVEQEIQYLSNESVPASIGVILDVSNSMNDILPLARDSIASFLDAGHTEDEYFLLEFNDQPRLTEDFTGDVDVLRNRLIQAPPVGYTAMYDAVYQGIAKVQGGRNPRKTLLIVTDGEDNHSRYSRSNIVDYIREAEVQIYAIGISPSFGKGPLRELADLTGGRAVFVDNEDADLEAIARQIALEMKSQYLLGYVSTNETHDGAWRELRVGLEGRETDAPLTVRARRGYYAGVY